MGERVLTGMPASPGVAAGRASVLDGALAQTDRVLPPGERAAEHDSLSGVAAARAVAVPVLAILARHVRAPRTTIPKLAGIGVSTPSQTGWALLALMAAGEVRSSSVERGVQYLLTTQLNDGTWDEDQFTGTGFPKFFMIKYHIYRNCFPLSALGTYRSLTQKDR